MASIFRFLKRYAQPFLPSYFMGVVMLIVTNFAVVRIPTLVGEVINAMESGGQSELLASKNIALEIMLWGVVLIGVRTLSRVLFFNPGREIQFRVMNDIFGHLLSLQRPFFLKHKVGELASITTNDTQYVRLLVGFSSLQIVNVAVAIPMHLGQMWMTDSVLTLWCVTPIVLGGIYMRHTIKRFHSMVRLSLEKLAELSDRILECYAGVATVRSHVAFDAVAQRFEERNKNYFDLLMRIAAIRAFSMPVLGFSGFIGTGIVLWVGGERVSQGLLPLGSLATFTALIMSLVSVLTSLAWVLAATSRGIVALKRVHEVLETSPDLPESKESKGLVHAPKVEVRNLSFSYPSNDEAVLKQLSFTLQPGQTLGVFGRTGSGKSTLIDVLARIYTPPPGSIWIDGVDVNDFDLKRYREGLAVVPQNPFLFSASLRANIVLDDEAGGHLQSEDAEEEKAGAVLGLNLSEGVQENPLEALSSDPNASGRKSWRIEDEPDPHLRHAIQNAAMESDIQGLPKALETIVGERGVMLSGGQRQRSALARSLYRHPHLLLLDDILSAVDQSTESKLVQAIRDLKSGGATGENPPTTVIVSHRASVLEHADQILVLEDGKVVERGNHNELLALNGYYAEAYEHQSKRDDEGGAGT